MRHPARIIVTALLIAFPAIFTAVSCSKEQGEREGAIAFAVQNVGETKASLVNDTATMTTKYGSTGFGLLGYQFEGLWNDNLTANFAYNDKCTESSGIWRTSGAYMLPGNSSRLRFFAYAPYNGNGITLPATNAQGVPVIQYTLPTNLSDQKDLLVSDTGSVPGGGLDTYHLTFEHPLTAVMFEVASDSATGTVKGITISGLYGSGSLPLDAAYWHPATNPWTPTGNRTVSYTATMNYAHTHDGGDTSLHEDPDNDIFLIIPQTLPVPVNPGDPCAKITVSFAAGASTIARNYERNIGGSFPWGRMLKLRLFIDPFLAEGENITWETFIASGETLTWIPYTGLDGTAQGSNMVP